MNSYILFTQRLNASYILCNSLKSDFCPDPTKLLNSPMTSQFVKSSAFSPTLQPPLQYSIPVDYSIFWNIYSHTLITLQSTGPSSHLCVHSFTLFWWPPFHLQLLFLILALFFCFHDGIHSSMVDFYANNFSSFITSLSPSQCLSPAFYLHAEHILWELVQGIKPTTSFSCSFQRQSITGSPQLSLNIQSLYPCH